MKQIDPNELAPHALADVFPAMTETEYAELLSDMREHGQREPIWIDGDGRILDGKHRWRACAEIGCDVLAREYEGDDAAAFVVSLNLHRRHLTSSQRAACAIEATGIMEQLRAEAKKRMEAGHNQYSPVEEIPQATGHEKSRDTAAKLFNTNPRYIDDAQRVKDRAPEEFEKVKRGEKSLTKVTEELRDKANKDKEKEQAEELQHKKPKPPADGLQYCGFAISQMERIAKNDVQRPIAWEKMRAWLDKHEE